MDPTRLSTNKLIFSSTGIANTIENIKNGSGAPTPINIQGDISKEQICALIEKYTDAKCA